MLKINQLYFIGYLHTLKLVSLVRVSWLVWLPAYLEPRALLVRVACVLVGSGYLHALNLVPCWFVWFVLVESGYLHTLNLVSLVGVSLVRVPCGWCACWK